MCWAPLFRLNVAGGENQPREALRNVRFNFCTPLVSNFAKRLRRRLLDYLPTEILSRRLQV